jgi:hypothetical protein
MVMPARVYVADSSKQQELKKLVEYDPYLDSSMKEEDLKHIREDASANVIFARQDYQIKEGASLSLNRDKIYLYISASEDFLERADKKLKAVIAGIERADPETEKKIISSIEDERKKAENGFGYIFG